MNTPDTLARIIKEAAKIHGWVPKHFGQNPSYEALRTQYHIVLASHSPTPTDPKITNDAICMTHGNIAWRGGIPFNLRWQPKVEGLRHLYRVWWNSLTLRLPHVRGMGTEERTAFAKRQCAMLLELSPFENGNSRTMLLFYYDLRRCLGLPLEIVTYENANALFDSIRTIQERDIRPLFRGRSFVLPEGKTPAARAA